MPEYYAELIRKSRFLPLHIGYLSAEHAEKAKTELNETDENRADAIASLRNLIIEKDELNCPLEDSYLLQYLRARKFDVDKSYKLLRNFYQTKKDHPECYTQFDYEKLAKLARAGYFLPYRSPDGCAVFVLEFNRWNVNENDMIDVMSILAIILLYAAEDPATQVCGLRAILNVKGATFRQIRCITPRYMVLLSKALRNCMPTRFKGIHVINESAIFQYTWGILKYFLTDKIRQRVIFHGSNVKQMHKLIPKEILTEEYGGCNKFFNPEESSKKMLVEMKPILDVILKCGLKD